MRITAALLILGLAACSSTTVTNGSPDSGAPTPGDDAGGGEDAGAEAAPFALTSTSLTEGAKLNAAQTCNGADQSPDLTWGPGPEGTKSYAIVLNDQTLDFLHSIIYDIPAIPGATLSLPANVDRAFSPTKVPGAKQNESFRKGRFGYAGPCPPKPNEDTYEFVLYALKVEKLANLTQTSTLAEAFDELEKQKLGTTKLTGKYKQP